MRCKKHMTDVTSNVGVCASCLRDKLRVVIKAQIEANQACQKSDSYELPLPPPPPPTLPRSASPHISTATCHNHRFFSTPQLGPTTTNSDSKNPKTTGISFSSLISGLFRSKSVKPDFNSGATWLSGFIRREKNSGAGKTRRNCDRGMSSAREEETPRRTPANVKRGGGAAGQCKSVSGMVFCLSPLVRPSPNRNRNQKMAPENSVAGEIRAPAKNLSNAASFCKNRSRKLVDLGKSNNYN